MTQPTTADLYYLVRGGTLLIRPVSLEAVEWYRNNKCRRPDGFYPFIATHTGLKNGTFETGSNYIKQRKVFTAKKINE